MIHPSEIGKRLKEFRLKHNLSPEDIAKKLSVSRAAVYRIEGGEIIKVETLTRLANIFDTSLGALLGIGVEYYTDGESFFERMRQTEEESDQIVAYFPPFSYLLTSAQYPNALRTMLIEGLPLQMRDKARQIKNIEAVLNILTERKKAQRQRQFSIINLVSAPEIERWLKVGAVGRFDLPPKVVEDRRAIARTEIEHLVRLIKSEPMGIQIALVTETLPNMAFQLFRSSEGTRLALSPFRLGGELPYLQPVVAMLTSDQQPVQQYEKFVEQLWHTAKKGKEAVDELQAALARSGI